MRSPIYPQVLCHSLTEHADIMPRTRTGYRNVRFTARLWARLVDRIAVVWPSEPECEQTVWVLPGCEVVSRAGD
jgi:hypothetical protein